MNFIEAYKKGQAGANKGLPMGEGLEEVSASINDIQREMIYVVAAAAKAGKSTFVDYGFVINPCLYVMDNNLKYQTFRSQGLSPEDIKIQYDLVFIELDIHYYSYEINRIRKEFDFAAHFLHKDFGIENISLEPGSTYQGKNEIPLSSQYIRGILTDDQGKLIRVKDSIAQALKTVYTNRIIPLFGEFDIHGNPISSGIIKFFDKKDNPTGIRNQLIKYAEENGKVEYTKFKGTDGKIHKRIIKYIPNNPDKYTIVVTDHLRKLIPERGFTAKQTVDKFSEYSVELKNDFGFTFVHIIHLNRSMTDTARIKQQDDLLYPNSDDVKETGNLAEDCDVMFTVFNPNDDRFSLTKHFSKMIKDRSNNVLYPNYRSVHLVESRDTIYPRHFRLNMFGNIKKFKKLIIP